MQAMPNGITGNSAPRFFVGYGFRTEPNLSGIGRAGGIPPFASSWGGMPQESAGEDAHATSNGNWWRALVPRLSPS